MDGFGLQLPTIQNWSCHSCSECCTRHVVEITEEERQRIVDQGWSDDDEFTEGTPVTVRDLGPFWNRRWRLGQKPNGAFEVWHPYKVAVSFRYLNLGDSSAPPPR